MAKHSLSQVLILHISYAGYHQDPLTDNSPDWKLVHRFPVDGRPSYLWLTDLAGKVYEVGIAAGQV